MTTLSALYAPLLKPESRAAAKVRAATLLAPATFIIVWIISLSRSLFDPIGFDQALWQFITERLMAGDRMYVDIWEQNWPGIIAIHWLSTKLVGTSPMALRMFDAGWQALTIAALVALGGRDHGRWRSGWLAGTLYALSYYSMGYVHTAQREGFAVLPLLLAVHLLLPRHRASRTWCLPGAAAGALCFAAFVIKPTLGLCFGMLWLLSVHDGWRRREQGFTAWAKTAGLSLGFVLAGAAGIAAMMHLRWWSGFLPVVLRQEMSGYVQGPQLIRELCLYAAIGSVVVLGAVGAMQMGQIRQTVREKRGQLIHALRLSGVALAVMGLMLTVQRWPDWQAVFLPIAGLLIPAIGAVLIWSWRGRSRVWQMAMLMMLAGLGSIVLQGRFFLYQFPPLLAFASYLAAQEIIMRMKRLGARRPLHGVWAMVCLGCVAHLAGSTWGRTMTYYSDSAYVLAHRTLDEHYTSITKHKTSYPAWSTTAKTAAVIRDITDNDDRIACLVDEPRLYYLARRAPVHRLLLTNPVLKPMFPEYIEAIQAQRPEVLISRLGKTAPEITDEDLIHDAVFDHERSRLGEEIECLRPLYRVTHVVDDLCVLQPVETRQLSSSR